MSKQNKRMLGLSCLVFALLSQPVGLLAGQPVGQPVGGDPLMILFMGDQGGHQPARRFAQLVPALESLGIQLRYTDRMEDLNPETLALFDGLLLYANIDRIEDSQARAVLDFVASGKGFIPIHSATYCWRNNPDMVALMGAQFQRHGGQVFSTVIDNSDHPVMQGFGGFSSWDETYIHHLHNETDRTVLEYRVEGEQAEGNTREPWTWVRTQGKGRVFYTAWGHDQRTWSNPGFHNLVARGIRWACGDDPGKVPAFVDPDRFVLPALTALPPDDLFEYLDVGPKIPQYTPGRNWGEQGRPSNMMQLPLSPEQSQQRFVHPEQMAVRRYADERDLEAKPVAMNWDEQGRLWICETVDYPNELGQNRDRIRILEDTNGDGVADQFTLFAEGLTIPTSLVPFRGGVVVQNGTETIYLKDTTGDGRADQKVLLISDWGMGDTHGGVSNFRYGLDNWIWAMQGYNYSSPKVDGRNTESFRQGFWRFKLSQTDPPRVEQLEFIRSSDNNTWGLGISEEGLIFGSTANRNPSMFMPIPNRYYERVRGWAPPILRSIADTHLFHPVTDKIRQVDHFGGYTAAAGHALYTARAFPSQWWNRTAFVCEPTGHLVGTFVLKREGANFTSSNPLNLLASDDEWSSPIMAEVGPDGAVWVIDWYNYIVQHNPTPHGFETGKGAAYESDLRDKKHGRIYRVVATSGGNDRIHAYDRLAEAGNQQLVAALRHPALVWRLTAQRLLVERGARDVVEELMRLVENPQLDEIGLDVAAIHALQTLAGLGCFQEQPLPESLVNTLLAGLKHPSAGVRRNALAVIPASQQGAGLLMQQLQLFADNDPQVRLQAVLTLADLPANSQAGPLLARLAALETDPVLIEGLTAAAATHDIPFIQQVIGQPSSTSPAAAQILRQVTEHLARGRPEAEGLRSLLAGIKGDDPERNRILLEGLIRGLPGDYRVGPSPELDQALVRAFQQIDSEGKFRLLQLANQAGSTALSPFEQETLALLETALANVQASPESRMEAASNLVNLYRENPDVAAKIVAQINPQTSPELASGLLNTLRRSEAEGVALQILGSLRFLTPQSKTAALAVLLSKPVWTEVLLQQAEKREFDLNELTLEQQQSLRASPDRRLRGLAEKVLALGGGLPDEDREKVIQSLMHITHQTGNVAAGREVFNKVCAACHIHGELGKAIGPELTGMAVHPKEELLIHILDPSRSVEGNYRLYNVLTIDGIVVNGMLAGETRTSITIIDSQANEINIPREEIEELAASRKSVMPEGYEQQLSEEELSNLLEFLTFKGRFLPISLDRYATAISTRGLFTEDENGPDQMIFPDWKPKTFNGVPFLLTDPKGQTTPNIILLNGPRGTLPPKMPRSVSLPCNSLAKKIHLLSGVGGWSYPFEQEKTVTMIVRLVYEDGQTEDHPLYNGVHFADYISRQDVPESEFAFRLRGQQIRFLTVTPQREALIKSIDLVKGRDRTAPIVMGITVER